MPSVKNTETTISEEEYLDGELISELKHEYIDGYVYAMAGAVETTVLYQETCLLNYQIS